jgi:hypothetical protein
MNLEGLQSLSKADYSGAKPVLDKPPRTSGN